MRTGHHRLIVALLLVQALATAGYQIAQYFRHVDRGEVTHAG